MLRDSRVRKIGRMRYRWQWCALLFSVAYIWMPTAAVAQCTVSPTVPGCRDLLPIAQSAIAVSQTSMVAVQTQLTTIRDGIQGRLTPSPGRPLGFAAEDPDQSLSYTASPNQTNPLYLKAPPAPASTTAGFGIWGQGFGDYERRTTVFDGVDFGRQTRTGGFIAGLDKVFTNVGGVSDQAFVIGVLAADIGAHVDFNDGSTARVTGPSVGAYAMWIAGRFSADFTFKTDFLSVDDSTGIPLSATPFDLTNYSFAFNLNRKFDFSGWWMEPTAGILDTRSIFDGAGHALGLVDGNDFRIQAGSRFGTTFMWGRASVDSTLTLLAYDSVSITGDNLTTALAGTTLAGTPVAGTPLCPSDQGKVFGQAIGKLNFDWSRDIKGLTTYVEADVRGTSDVFGVGGRVGARYTW